MRYIIEKTGLLICGLVVATGEVVFSFEQVAIILMMAILTIAMQVELLRWLDIVYCLSCMLVIAFSDTAIYLLPLLTYTAVTRFDKWGLLTLIGFTTHVHGILLCWSVVAAYLAYRTKTELSFQAESYRQQVDFQSERWQLRQHQLQLESDYLHRVELARLTERNQIAHNLHDTLGHLISSSILQLEAIAVVTQDEQTAMDVQQLSARLQDGMTDIRHHLHQIYNDSIDLNERIHSLTAAIPQDRLTCHCVINSELTIPFKTAIIAIVKELVTNYQKHAGTSRVRIAIIEQNGLLSINYKDNGKTVATTDASQGIGLLSMNDTVEKYGGTLRIDQQNGFSVYIILPITEELCI